mmetsp:Transcript_11278/g.24422  ORF Transcript_11278/g.24422 Transcript_11278/m.24422 type:complete len:218 (+) Transcript_11278:428-1081(+)
MVQRSLARTRPPHETFRARRCPVQDHNSGTEHPPPRSLSTPAEVGPRKALPGGRSPPAGQPPPPRPLRGRSRAAARRPWPPERPCCGPAPGGTLTTRQGCSMLLHPGEQQVRVAMVVLTSPPQMPNVAGAKPSPEAVAVVPLERQPGRCPPAGDRRAGGLTTRCRLLGIVPLHVRSLQVLGTRGACFQVRLLRRVSSPRRPAEHARRPGGWAGASHS